MDCLVRFRPRAVCVDSRLRLRSRPRTAGGGDAGLLFGKKQRYIKCSCKKNNVIVFFFSFFPFFYYLIVFGSLYMCLPVPRNSVGGL